MFYLLTLLCITLQAYQVYCQAINWNGNNWALNCDFRGNDLKEVQAPGPDCGSICDRTDRCTHYAINKYKGGTCWLKSGTVSKANAIYNPDPSSACGVKAGGVNPTTTGIQFQTINNCPHPIWVGFQGQSKSNPNYRVPFNGGWLQNSGERRSFGVPNDLFASRIWARTNCATVNGRFRCETGDCGPWVECAHDGIQRGGETPASLAEITLVPNVQDYYDVSLVDGFNVKIAFQPTNPSSGNPPDYWCKTPSCNANLNDICPNELRKYGSNGQTIGCRSACDKFRTDQYCCAGNFNTPQTCKSSTWPFNYPAVFKRACPTAYSYAYDDASSTFFCKNTNYNIIFC